jgi:transposase
VWREHRLVCVAVECPVLSWTVEDHDRLTSAGVDRPGRTVGRVTEQVGRSGRTVNEVAVEGCDWRTVKNAVIAYGTVLVDDPAGIGLPTALGLDETLFCRQGQWRHQSWSTSIVDVGTRRLLDVVAGRRAAEPCRWLAARGEKWLKGIAWATWTSRVLPVGV